MYSISRPIFVPACEGPVYNWIFKIKEDEIFFQHNVSSLIYSSIKNVSSFTSHRRKKRGGLIELKVIKGHTFYAIKTFYDVILKP